MRSHPHASRIYIIFRSTNEFKLQLNSRLSNPMSIVDGNWPKIWNDAARMPWTWYMPTYAYIRNSTWRHANECDGIAPQHDEKKEPTTAANISRVIFHKCSSTICAFWAAFFLFGFVCSFRCFVWIFDVRSLKWYSILHRTHFIFLFRSSSFSCLSQFHSCVRSFAVRLGCCIVFHYSPY